MEPITVRGGQGTWTQTIEIRNHRLTADETAELGGEDRGPNPHEYLAAALGGCTAITVRMYARRKEWPLDDVIVRVNIEKEGDQARFVRTLELKGALDADQRQRLLGIAGKCPVHKTLSGTIAISTALVE